MKAVGGQRDSRSTKADLGAESEAAGGVLAGIRAVVVTVSTRAAAGVYEDTAGVLAAETLNGWGAVVERVVVADAEVDRGLGTALAGAADLVLTTGGTGISPTDRTPEATAELVDVLVPGVGEAVRAAGARSGVSSAALSRGLAGVVRAGGASGRATPTLVINLPGSRGGVADALEVLEPMLSHAVSQMRGGDH